MFSFDYVPHLDSHGTSQALLVSAVPGAATQLPSHALHQLSDWYEPLHDLQRTTPQLLRLLPDSSLDRLARRDWDAGRILPRRGDYLRPERHTHASFGYGAHALAQPVASPTRTCRTHHPFPAPTQVSRATNLGTGYECGVKHVDQDHMIASALFTRRPDCLPVM
jgi:hypothetical protein